MNKTIAFALLLALLASITPIKSYSEYSSPMDPLTEHKEYVNAFYAKHKKAGDSYEKDQNNYYGDNPPISAILGDKTE